MPAENIEKFIQNIAEHMRIPCEVSVSAGETGAIRVAIHAPENGKLLIGKNGQNLKALEHIIRILWMKTNPEVEAKAVVVDVNDYRAEQTQTLIKTVHETAARVRETQKSEAMHPMSSYERRIVHTELASYSDLVTESIGQDPHRRVIVKPL